MRKNAIAIALAALAVGMMLFGAYRGEVSVVLNKATRVCLECVGIG